MIGCSANHNAIMPKIFFYCILSLAYFALCACGMSNAQQINAGQSLPAIKKIALSFDDSPRHVGGFLSPIERRKLIISSLRKGNIDQAAFFINPGRIADENRKNIEAYANAGHVLANHTADHMKLSDITADMFLADVDAAEAWLKVHRASRPWMRFPYLDEGGHDKVKRDAIRHGLAQRSLRNGYVTAGASDWYIDDLASKALEAGEKIDREALGNLFVDTHLLSANFADALALQILGRSPIHVMLLHEADVTALYLADLISALKSDGWQIVTADEAYTDPLGDMLSTNAYAGGTILGMLADDKDIRPQWYESNNKKVIEALFRKYVLQKEE